MTRDIIPLKADLLCLGARVETETAKLLEAEYPRFFERGFIHAVNIHTGDANINISVAEEFSSESPYLVVKRDEQYRIVGKGWDEPITFYENLPRTGTVLDDLARLHSPTCINIWPSTVCCYDTPEMKCRFCSLTADAEKPLDTGEMSRDLRLLLAQLTEEYHLLL